MLMLWKLAALLLLTLPGQRERNERTARHKETDSMDIHRWLSANGCFTDAASWADGVPPAVAAVGTLTLVGNAQDAETVLLDEKTYTFQDVLTDVNGNVHVGADAEESIENLAAAVVLGPGSGTAYAASTTLHSSVSAAKAAADEMAVEAKTKGVSANDLVTTETLANASFGGGTLSGGTLWTLANDTALFNGSVTQHVTSGLDLSENSDLPSFNLITTPKDAVNIGGAGSPLRNYSGLGARVTIRGIGSVYLEPAITSKDEYIVDSQNGTDALLVTGGEILGIYVKRGAARVAGNAFFNVVNSDAMTDGTGAKLTINLPGASPPIRTIANGGTLQTDMTTTDETIICVTGKLEYTGVIGDGSDIHVTGGALQYIPSSDVSAGTPQAFISIGVLDLSKSAYTVGFDILITGQMGQVYGEVFTSGGKVGDIDLGEPYP